MEIQLINLLEPSDYKLIMSHILNLPSTLQELHDYGVDLILFRRQISTVQSRKHINNILVHSTSFKYTLAGKYTFIQ